MGSSDDYLNIKIDSHTNEYTIGTPVSIGSLDSAPSSWAVRKSHSLALTEEKGRVSVLGVSEWPVDQLILT